MVKFEAIFKDWQGQIKREILSIKAQNLKFPGPSQSLALGPAASIPPELTELHPQPIKTDSAV